MELRQLEVFTTVVEKNSFSQAAQKLNLTQPTISSHIRQLEQELNATLIVRTTRSISVTEAGQKLYHYATSILEIRQKIVDEFSGKSAHLIKLGVSTIPAAYVFPEVLAKYQQQYPAVQIQAWQSNSAGIIEKVAQGSLDLGLVGMKSNNEDCLFEPFIRDELVIATPASAHFKSLKKVKDRLSTLMKEPFIMRENGSGSKKQADFILEELGIDRDAMNIVAFINDQEVIKKMISRGIGISIMSSLAAQDMVKSNDLLVFSLGEQQRFRDLYIVTRKNNILPKHVRQFISLVKKSYNML